MVERGEGMVDVMEMVMRRGGDGGDRDGGLVVERRKERKWWSGYRPKEEPRGECWPRGLPL